jgi:hypothetical protein
MKGRKGDNMFRMITLSVFAAALTGSAVLAQTPMQMAAPTLRSTAPEPFKFLSHRDLANILMTPERGRVYSGHVVNDHENYYVEFVKRLDNGNMVEVHANWHDFITILSGDGSVSYGGTVSGADQAGPGETRGGTMTGGTTKALHSGDYIQIPAGMPHKIEADAGQQLNYVIFKVRQ